MSENTIPKATEQNTEIQTPNTRFHIDYILSKIEEIQTETSYLYEAISKLAAMNDGDSGSVGAPGNFLGAEKAKAFGDIVRCRETTNQHLIKLYEKMYDNLIIGGDKQITIEKWNAVSKLADAALIEDDWVECRDNMISEIRQILRENK